MTPRCQTMACSSDLACHQASPSLVLDLTLIRMITGTLDRYNFGGRRLLNPGPWAQASKPWTLASKPLNPESFVERTEIIPRRSRRRSCHSNVFICRDFQCIWAFAGQGSQNLVSEPSFVPVRTGRARRRHTSRLATPAPRLILSLLALSPLRPGASGWHPQSSCCHAYRTMHMKGRIVALRHLRGPIDFFCDLCHAMSDQGVTSFWWPKPLIPTC